MSVALMALRYILLILVFCGTTHYLKGLFLKYLSQMNEYIRLDGVVSFMYDITEQRL